MSLVSVSRKLCRAVADLTFEDPVAYVYNPLDYARAPHERYLERYGKAPKRVLLVGMNPGPFGMAQTGVPFGDVSAVRDWLGISAPVRVPSRTHPKRPIFGFDCPRSEVSGTRLWGWARDRFGQPERFFETFFVANYCPLLFVEDSGRNRTPDKLPRSECAPLFEACDRALQAIVDVLSPEFVIGVGQFAEKRSRLALTHFGGTVDTILHPSPASPKANRGWAEGVDAKLSSLGIDRPKTVSRSNVNERGRARR